LNVKPKKPSQNPAQACPKTKFLSSNLKHIKNSLH
jgi:hypothetical protein